MPQMLSPELFLQYIDECAPDAANNAIVKHIISRVEADTGHTMDHRSLMARVSAWRKRQPSAQAVSVADEHAQHAAVGAAPPGYRVKGTSTLTGPSGEVKARWLKTQVDPSANDLETLTEALHGILSGYKPLKPAKAPRSVEDDILTVVPLGDPHVGMLSFHLETGQDWDLKIAEQTITAAADHLIDVAPASRSALIINLGDFFHSDDQSNRTRGHGHELDVDGRWSKVLHVGLRTMRRVIDRALRKHQHVEVWNVIGNHDSHSAVMLSLTLAHLYESDPRVTVNTSPSKFYYRRFGRCLIAATHGDTCKRQDLGGVLMVDRPQDVGDTRHRYWYTGHIHHERVMELPGCVVESFRTLAPADAWHHGAGLSVGPGYAVRRMAPRAWVGQPPYRGR